MWKVRVSVSGCHDTTSVEIDATPAQAKFLQRVAEAVTYSSRDQCQPTMDAVIVPKEKKRVSTNR